MARRTVLLATVAFIVLPGISFAQAKRALLIGINTYQPARVQCSQQQGPTEGRFGLAALPNLEGALNDVQAMRDLLISPKFGFSKDRVFILPEKDATHDGMLSAMRKYLVDEPQRGDTVVFYFAGHGSLRVNSKSNKRKIYVDRVLTPVDNTIVAADAYKQAFDVRDREIARIFNAALDKGVKLTAIFDSCHSGTISRGLRLKSTYKERLLAYDPRDINEAPDTMPDGTPAVAPEDRTDNPALVFTAAQPDQAAKEAPGKAGSQPHGAFTAALVEALQVLPANVPASDIYKRVKVVLENARIPDQDPWLGASAARTQQPLFGGTAESGKVRAAALGMEGEDAYLDIGRVADVGPQSQFSSLVADAKGRTVRLEITELKGLTRSKAKVVAPAGAKVQPGDVFELTKWVPAKAATLSVWMWPANLSQDEIKAAAEQVKLSQIDTVEDPAEQPWTHIIMWNGERWLLQPAGSSEAVDIGVKLSAASIRAKVPARAKVWVNLPSSRELATKLSLHDEANAVQGVGARTAADYWLAGRLTKDGVAYAWFHATEVQEGSAQKGPQATIANRSPGCSASSRYPVRTEWVDVSDASLVNDGAAALNQYASRLAKVHGWLNLQSSITGDTPYPYRLVLKRQPDNQLLAKDELVHGGDHLQLALHSETGISNVPRWVYVLDIDCHGKGTLLFPTAGGENRFPNRASYQPDIDLPNAVVKIQSPFGVDTLVVLTTSTPLPDPSVLNFEGVRGGTRGVGSPLYRLLDATSSGTRGAVAELPTDWGIDYVELHSGREIAK